MAGSNKSGMDTAGVCCCLLAFVLYYNTLDAGFVYDDRRAVLGNPDVLGSNPWSQLLVNDFWGTPLTDTGSHGSYRPLCVLSFRLNHLIGGFRPYGYHLVNVLLHCMATALVIKVAKVLLPQGWCAPTAGALFASHPVHTEAVAGVVGRADLAACNLFLLSFLSYATHVRWRDRGDPRHWGALGTCLALAIASILCKETSAPALLVCALYDVIRRTPGIHDKKRWRSLSILGLGLAAMMHWRLSLPGPATHFSSADNPAARSPSIWTRFLTFLYLPVFNFQLLVSPITMSFDWGMDAIPRVTSLCDSRNLTTGVFYTALGAATWGCVKALRVQSTETFTKKLRVSRKRLAAGVALVAGVVFSECMCTVCRQGLSTRHSSSCRAINNNNSPPPAVPCACPPPTPPPPPPPPLAGVVLICVALITLPFLPATNLFFYVGFVVAERVLYLPSVGYCLLVGLGIGKLLESRATWLPRRVYRKRICSAFLTLVLVAFCARTVRRNLDWRDEESLYRSAIPVNPPKALGNLGSVLSAQGRSTEAKEALLGALRHRPNMADVHYNLGVLLQNQQDYNAAVESFQRAIHFRPSLALAYLNLGASLISLGRCQEAASVLRRGSRLDGTGLRDRSAHDGARLGALLQLGGLYAEQGRLQRALAVYREALHTLPEHYPPQGIYHRLGDTLARLHQWAEAERFHRAALQAQPDHVAAHLSYGNMLAQNSSRAAEAEQWFKRALRLAPSDPSVYHHYGEFLSSMSRHQEACTQRVRAAELSPDNYSLVVAAATALRLLDRKAEAEWWYRQAVLLRPDDARAHTNLGAILHLQGRSSQAASSYREALKLQPGDSTTMANLAKLGVVGA